MMRSENPRRLRILTPHRPAADRFVPAADYPQGCHSGNVSGTSADLSLCEVTSLNLTDNLLAGSINQSHLEFLPFLQSLRLNNNFLRGAVRRHAPPHTATHRHTPLSTAIHRQRPSQASSIVIARSRECKDTTLATHRTLAPAADAALPRRARAVQQPSHTRSLTQRFRLRASAGEHPAGAV